MDQITDQLLKIKSLWDNGVLSESEFNELKQRIISEDYHSTDNESETKEKLYTVSLVAYTREQKIPTIQTIRELTGLGLADAKDLIETLPHVIRDNVPMSECIDIKNSFATNKAVVVIEESRVTSESHPTGAYFGNTVLSENPSCPYCHSPDVKKITMTKKLAKGWVFGLAAASTLTKEWHCNNCKSDF